MKKNQPSLKKNTSKSISLFKFVAKHRWLLLLLLGVTALAAVPLVKQQAQVELNSDSKERVQQNQKGRSETNESSVISLSESQLAGVRENANALRPTVGIDLGEEVEPNDTFGTATVLSGSEAKIRGDISPTVIWTGIRLPALRATVFMRLSRQVIRIAAARTVSCGYSDQTVRL